MNKQAFKLYDITEKDYELWCKNNGKRKCSKSSEAEFFKKVLAGQLAKDKNGNLIRKHSDR